MTATSTYTPTGDSYVDGVLTGVKWGVASLTFSFPSDPTFYGTSYGSGEPTHNFEAFTAQQQAAVRSVLSMYSSVANLTFTEVTETSSVHGDLRYAETDAVSTAWGYYPSTSAAGGDAWFNNTSNWYDNPIKGNYGYLTMLHETGHALGLKHPHEARGSFGPMPLDHDSLEYSVMSYRSYVGASTTGGYTNGSTSYPQTLMMYDIAALQSMYGANYNTNSGDTVYKWSSSTSELFINGVGQGAPGGNKVFMTLWDGGGKDTYDLSNYSSNLTVNLDPGAWTTVSTTQLASLGSGHYAAGNIANALLYQGNTASLIESAIGGSGNDALTGNAADNALTGGGGNDLLDGGIGNDMAVYSGLLSNYLLVQNTDGTWTITDLRGGSPDGTDILANIELLKFSDQSYTLASAVVVNQAPAAVDDVASTVENTAIDINVLANDSDPDGNVLSILGAPTALHGIVTVNTDGTLHYVPNASFSGSDTIAYVVTDGLLSDSGQVAVTVSATAVNHAPVAMDDTATMSEDTAVNIDVLGNDADPDGNALWISGAPTALHGTVTVNSDGTLHYVPNANYNGADTISYLVTDGALTDSAQVAMTVSAVNDAPLAQSDAYATAKNTKLTISTNGVLANDSDVDGTGLSAVLVGKPAHGKLALKADGTFTYTPDRGFVGTDSFTYRDSDGSASSNLATVTISVGQAAGHGAAAGATGDGLAMDQIPGPAGSDAFDFGSLVHTPQLLVDWLGDLPAWVSQLTPAIEAPAHDPIADRVHDFVTALDQWHPHEGYLWG